MVDIKNNRNAPTLCAEYSEFGEIIRSDYITSISRSYYNITCVVNGFMRFANVIYPILYASSPDKLEDKLRILHLAEKEKLMQLKSEQLDSKTYYIILFNKKYLDEVLLYIYLRNNFQQSVETTLLMTKLSIIKDTTKKYFIHMYLKGEIKLTPIELLNLFIEVDENPNLQFNEKITRKYDITKEFDNFKNMNILYENTYKSVIAFEKQVKESPGFKKFAAKTKPKLYKLNLAQVTRDNPFYTPEVRNNITKFISKK